MATADSAGLDLGRLLGTWRRRVAGLTQTASAGRLDPPPATGALSMWEHGRRRPSWRRLGELDAAYGAGGALVDIAAALDTPQGLPSRRVWTHNFSDEGGPVWAWLRPATAGRLQAVLRWGAFGLDLRERCTARGLFVTVPTSMRNPAAWVILRAPGWVDFGRGRPPAALGIPIIEALDHATVTDGPHSAAGLVSRAVSERYRSDAAFATEVQRLFGARPDIVDRVFSTSTGWQQILDVGPAPARRGRRAGAQTLPSATFSGAQYTALRVARHMSLREVADAATALQPDIPVSDDHVRRLEGSGAPRLPRLRSRLDAIYRADGRTCTETITPRRDPTIGGRWVLEFPGYWVGPVWLQVDGPAGATADVVLEWEDSYLPLRVHPGRLLTCRRAHRAAPPARLSLPAEWTLSAAGVGAREHAVDINWGWYGLDAEADSTPVHERFLALFGRTLDELHEAIPAVSWR